MSRGHALSDGEVALALASALSVLGLAAAYPLWSPHFHVACPAWVLAGIPCPTCGGTRALVAVVNGEWLTALRWNPLVAAAGFGLIAWIPLALGILAGLVSRPRIPIALGRGARIAMALLAALNWVYLWGWFRG